MPAVRELLLRSFTRPAVQMRRLVRGTACRRADSRGGWLPRRLVGDPSALFRRKISYKQPGQSGSGARAHQDRWWRFCHARRRLCARTVAGFRALQLPGLVPRALAGRAPCRRADSSGVRGADAPTRRESGRWGVTTASQPAACPRSGSARIRERRFSRFHSPHPGHRRRLLATISRFQTPIRSRSNPWNVGQYVTAVPTNSTKDWL
jgi:hypothetical protein